MTQVLVVVRYLIRLTLPRARAHGVHPQVGVHVIGADARVGVGDVRQRSQPVFRPHRHARHEPDGAREQRPPHLRSGTQLNR